jgi:ATP-dependent Clp protease ATP-binding subunit ClpA
MQQKPDHIGDLSNQLIDHLVKDHIYSPEFLNRFDGVVVYKPLTKEAIVAIARSKLSELKEKILAQNGLSINFSDAFVTNLIQQGYDPRFGARNMERIIRDQVEDKVAQLILQNPTQGQSITF